MNRLQGTDSIRKPFHDQPMNAVVELNILLVTWINSFHMVEGLKGNIVLSWYKAITLLETLKEDLNYYALSEQVRAMKIPEVQVCYLESVELLGGRLEFPSWKLQENTASGIQ